MKSRSLGDGRCCLTMSTGGVTAMVRLWWLAHQQLLELNIQAGTPGSPGFADLFFNKKMTLLTHLFGVIIICSRVLMGRSCKNVGFQVVVLQLLSIVGCGSVLFGLVCLWISVLLDVFMYHWGLHASPCTQNKQSFVIDFDRLVVETPYAKLKNFR